MRIVADENIPLVNQFFDDLGEVVRYPGRRLTAQQVRDADVLLVRSVTGVDSALLEGSRVNFVASATIGTDHVDLGYLHSRGIGFANAPGCNADSVVDYVLSVLINLAAISGEALQRRRIGIIGAGNVGGRLQQRLERLGLQVLINDPPRAERESGGASFHSLEQLLERCDVLCLHTPLTTSGAHPSFHLLDEQRLRQLRPGAWLINAGRGGAIDNSALSRLLAERDDLEVVLDVWEGEPTIDAELARRVRWGTPHIAGYSLEGRMRGTEMIYRAVCNHFGVAAGLSLQQLLPPPELRGVQIAAAGPGLARRLVNLVYDLREDHYRLQATLTQAEDARGAAFDRLRKEYPMRREFSSLMLAGLEPHSAEADLLAALGFTLGPDAGDLSPPQR